MTSTNRVAPLLDIAEQRAARVALDALLPAMLASDSTREPLTLVLHGPAGSGKSFLAHRFAESLSSDFRVRILKASDDWRIEDSEAPADAEFALLVVEDLQFLPLNAAEWFCRMIDRRESKGLATIVTASAGPRHLRFRGQPHSARLTSRLSAGNVVAVPLPSLASRRLALDALLGEADLLPPAEVVDLIARQSRSIRALEGAVNQLKLLARLDDGASMKAGTLLKHFRAQADADQPKIETIVQRVAGHFQVAAKDLRSKSRQRGFVVPRHVSMYLARRLTEMSFQQIGAYFGGCDHATVLHACRKVESTLDADPQLGGTVRQLQGDLE